MKQQKTLIKPRKKPLQSRSNITVDAIFEATIQVLLALGPDKLTTTKVAERAGVSVGTLYQYFGDKRGLLYGVLERHLDAVTSEVEAACKAQRGQPTNQAVEKLISAFFDAKFSHAAASRALYLISPDIEGQKMIATLIHRAQLAICELLSQAPDRCIEDPNTTSMMIVTALTGPVQFLLETDAPPEHRVKAQRHAEKMIIGYLKEAQ